MYACVRAVRTRGENPGTNVRINAIFNGAPRLASVGISVVESIAWIPLREELECPECPYCGQEISLGIAGASDARCPAPERTDALRRGLESPFSFNICLNLRSGSPVLPSETGVSARGSLDYTDGEGWTPKWWMRISLIDREILIGMRGDPLAKLRENRLDLVFGVCQRVFGVGFPSLRGLRMPWGLSPALGEGNPPAIPLLAGVFFFGDRYRLSDLPTRLTAATDLPSVPRLQTSGAPSPSLAPAPGSGLLQLHP